LAQGSLFPSPASSGRKARSRWPALDTLEIAAARGYNFGMPIVSIRDAKNRLPELVRRAEKGERITVTRNGKPVADITVHQKKGGIDFEAGDRWLKARGLKRPESWIAPNFDDPLPEDFLISPITYPDEK
jgi:antitoxin (DNA-binding transcriptional repressor) of toxin-antitoxin stability system